MKELNYLFYLAVDFSVEVVVVVLVEDLLSSGGDTGLLQSESGELEFLLEPDVTEIKENIGNCLKLTLVTHPVETRLTFDHR